MLPFAGRVTGRTPVLAVGSNGSPAQLLAKLGAAVVPITMAEVPGIGAGFSAHVSLPGYVPYVPVAAAGTRRFPLLWLDDAQLTALDLTEPNYHRVAVHRVSLAASGEAVAGCWIYRGRWGALAIPPGNGPLPAASQADVFARLAAVPWFAALVPECRPDPLAAQGALAADATRRAAVRHHLAARGHAVPDGL